MNRLTLGIVQHVFMALAAFIVIIVFRDSIIRVDNYQNDSFYRVDLFDDSPAFEETEVYNEMFYNSVSDLVTLVVLRNQFETDGVYDGNKLIDITAFVNRREYTSSCPVTAVYYLDDLVKWGKTDAEMFLYRMSKKDFVNYFNDNLLDISHFYLDIDGSLRYSWEEIEDRTQMELSKLPEGTDASQYEEDFLDTYLEDQFNQLQEVYGNYQQYNEAQLVNLAFSYIASHMDKPISLVDVDGEERVEVQMLQEKYMTADTKLSPRDIAHNWIEYCQLENNIIEVLDSLKQNYEIYEQKIRTYSPQNTNLQYMFRLQGENGEGTSCTNLSETFLALEENEIDYYFQNLGKYLIYSVRDIICESNVWIRDEDLYNMVDTYSYAYPDDTVIWIGVPERYSIENDIFAAGKRTFDRIVLHIRDYTMAVICCFTVWLAIGIYLTFSIGRYDARSGKYRIHLNWFDRIYFEFLLLLIAGLFLIGRIGLRILLTAVANGNYQGNNWLIRFFSQFEWSLGVTGFLYGFLVSLSFCTVWYSLVRRIRCWNIWRDSLLHRLYVKICRGASMVLYHKSAAVRTLIPYNCFLLVNLLSIAAAYLVRRNPVQLACVIIGIIILDAVMGVYLFRNNAEFVEIVEAIKKIRLGEVSYQLEPGKLHGENQEIAEDLNHIGEGIRNAVATSVKDERLKSDLITNVSHDIKTPLTSIINYVDLLKRENIQQEPVKTYIEILDSKTQRLKQLTDDLVEASKISSGNIVLEKERLNLTELLNQSIGEFSEKFEELHLQIVFEQNSREAFIYADSRRMWRVVENLFNNVCKYTMPDTRVYIELQKENHMVEVTIKNISKQQLNIKVDDLTERFIRGDESRTTEGSGLGLSIAKSLMEAQGGSFRIDLDGDLFKVTLQFPEMEDDGEGSREDMKGKKAPESERKS